VYLKQFKWSRAEEERKRKLAEEKAQAEKDALAAEN